MPASPIIPGFMVIHGNQPEDLRSLILGVIQRYPLEPLENETILVQSNGIAQWLKMALAQDPDDEQGGGCGIAAALDVQLPGTFIWRLYRAALGKDNIPAESLLDKAPLTWRFMRLLPALMNEPHFAPLARFLRDDNDLRKRYQLSERLADLFDQYQVYRADWLEDWAQGRHQLRDHKGHAKPLAEQHRWQAELWRHLLADVGESGMAQSRAGVHQRYLQHMANATEAPHGLPRRVIVFGISSLPAQVLDALAELARFCQVLLCVHNPCRHHWADIVADKDLLRHAFKRQQRKAGTPQVLDPATLHQHAQPLLAAWGKQGRDYIHLLEQYDDPQSYREQFNDGRIDLFSEVSSNTLLGQLQDDILDLRPLRETQEYWPAVDPQADHSLRFHAAHSAQREVEILHDQLLAQFSEDPTLNPRDVIVMVPQIDTYAPHIRAVFGQLEHRDPRYIPFTLADQSQRGRTPLLIALEHLLNLPESRFAVSEVLDLLDVPALRNRFGIHEADLPTLRRWIEGAGIRWGLDATQRASLGLPEGMEQNSWRFGLRRMLLGYAVGNGEAFEEIEPFDEIGGLDAALIGPLAALLDALDSAHQALSQPGTPEQWGERLQTLLRRFFSASDEQSEYLLVQLEALRDQWLETCESVGLVEALPLAVVRDAWLAGVDQGNLGQHFLGGSVNFCTLMPMRAIPFRRVCLLGMNDGDFPRAQPPLDFDLMGSDYRPGDRSRREDDRYLLLEALLSAQERLYISWVGRSIRDNSERPASVLIGQLRDHLAAGWRLADGGDLLHALTTEHPLQPFSLQYFQANSPLASYAREWEALYQHHPAPMAEAPLPMLPLQEPLDPTLLQDFLRQPVRHFFRQRLKVYFEAVEPPVPEAEPFSLDGLERYTLSEALLAQAIAHPQELAAEHLSRAAVRLQGQGALPMAGFGEMAQATLVEPLPALLQRYHQLLERWPEPLQGALPARFEHAGIVVEGWLAGLHRGESDELLHATLVANALGDGPKRKWHRLLRSWVNHLFTCSQGHRLTTALVATDCTLLLPPMDRIHAEEHLAALLDAWRVGICSPLPVATRTAFAWLREGDPEKAQALARPVYEGDANISAERDETAALARQYPDFASLADGGGFAHWSQALYGPIMAAGWQHQPAQEGAE
ncbi:exodeoxyribonuclease V subunit gamma [Pseudomonas sp. KNUC1026]|uniref:exodeoxyribonuclease V subunit gamma n=1 Tax=Pseudomonas sp. KNUC1026 TaxID=2893890 RepID=UPI001F39D338|nr:exodeoxyribonuclease V subunit gamma [Pseudomonas sp. KNUC1026]UFH49850.1 exodeoxyribonuclease V subunit gamma [Pseudomonas sp. KNUC1026]